MSNLTHIGDGDFIGPPDFKAKLIEPPYELAWNLIDWASDEKAVVVFDAERRCMRCVLCDGTSYDAWGDVSHAAKCKHLASKATMEYDKDGDTDAGDGG